MKKFFSFENVINTITRFPLCFVYSILITAVFIFMNNFNYYENTFEKVSITLVSTFFLSLGFYLFSESAKQDNLKKYLLQFFAIILGILYYFYIQTNFGPHILIITFGYLMFVYFSPYLAKNKEKHNYYAYLVKISEAILTSMLVGTIICILGEIAILSINNLFDIDLNYFSDELYEDWVILSYCFFAPLYGLSKIPEKIFKLEPVENKFEFFLIKFIGIPFILLYFIILYAYSFKVLINFSDWPRGQIVWLVIAFSSFGYLIYMFSSFYEAKNSAIRIFRKYFPFVVIPQLFMLFYAIYLRIDQYGVTMNRYLVVIFGVWLAIISVYFIISKKKNLIIIPFILTIFSILISIGPWSIYRISEASQFARLIDNLQKANILKDGEIVYLNDYTDIDEDLSKSIYSQIRYLCDFDDCKIIKNIFYKEYEELLKEDPDAPDRRIRNFVTQKIKVQYYFNSTKYSDVEWKYFEYSGEIFPIDIAGYDEIEEIYYYSYLYEKGIEKKEPMIWDEFEDFNLGKYIVDNAETMTFEYFYGDKKYKFILNFAHVNTETYEIKEIGGYVLVGNASE